MEVIGKITRVSIPNNHTESMSLPLVPGMIKPEIGLHVFVPIRGIWLTDAKRPLHPIRQPVVHSAPSQVATVVPKPTPRVVQKPVPLPEPAGKVQSAGKVQWAHYEKLVQQAEQAVRLNKAAVRLADTQLAESISRHKALAEFKDRFQKRQA